MGHLDCSFVCWFVLRRRKELKGEPKAEDRPDNSPTPDVSPSLARILTHHSLTPSKVDNLIALDEVVGDVQKNVFLQTNSRFAITPSLLST